MKTTITIFSRMLCLLLLITSFSLSASPIDNIDNYYGECDSEDVSFEISCPYDVTVSCTDEIWDLSIYGNAQYYYDYQWYDAGQPVVSWNLNSCDIGTITRTWSVEDPDWNIVSCTQTITVTGSGAGFNESYINWPQENITLEGCYPSTHPSQLPPGWGYPTWDYYGDCASIGVSHSDQVFTISPTCKKIVRKWQVMDWCQYNPNVWSPSGNTPGLWVYYQFIKISQGDVPVLVCPEDIKVNSTNCVDKYVHTDPLWVDGEACGGDFVITNDSPYADSNGADISGTYPIGWHYVKYTVKFGCGQKKTCTRIVKVTDKKPPTPYCYAEIAIPLMGVDEDGDGIPEDGMVEIWAKDLDKGSTASCNGGMLQFSFGPDVTQTFLTFTCADVGENVVEMWVTDSDGNQSYCLVTIHVQNNGANIPDCEPADDDDDDDDDDGGNDDDDDDDDTTPEHVYYVGGKVMTAEGIWMDSVKVTLMNDAPDTSYVVTLDTTINIYTDSMFNEVDSSYTFTLVLDTTVTANMDTLVNNLMLMAYSGDWGFYRFGAVGNTGDEFTISAQYFDDGYSNGINTQDLNFLMDYVVGNAEFTSSHQKIAADVNKDGAVDFDDLKLLLEYLTGEVENFGVGNEWVFVDADQLESDNADEVYENPDTEVNVTVADQNVEDADIIGIRLGDIVFDSTAGIVNDASISNLNAMVSDNPSDTELEARIRELNEESADIQVYPNPFTQSFQIEVASNTAKPIIIILTDVSGKKVYENRLSLTKGQNSITIDTNKKGVLLYQIIDGENITSGKVISL